MLIKKLNKDTPSIDRGNSVDVTSAMFSVRSQIPANFEPQTVQDSYCGEYYGPNNHKKSLADLNPKVGYKSQFIDLRPKS